MCNNFLLGASWILSEFRAFVLFPAQASSSNGLWPERSIIAAVMLLCRFPPASRRISPASLCEWAGEFVPGGSLRCVGERNMSGTERAAYRPLQGRDRTFDNLPSNFDRGRYTPGLAADFSDDPLPKFLSELHDYPLNRIEERKRIRFLKPALIAGLLVSAFAILLSVFGPNDMSVLADKARGKLDDVTKDLRAALTVLDHPVAARRSPVDPARESKALTLTSVHDAQATVGTANRGDIPLALAPHQDRTICRVARTYFFPNVFA
jgi:hypothetical protein